MPRPPIVPSSSDQMDVFKQIEGGRGEGGTRGSGYYPHLEGAGHQRQMPWGEQWQRLSLDMLSCGIGLGEEGLKEMLTSRTHSSVRQEKS